MNAESSARHYDAAENLLEEAESHREPDTRAEWCLELAKVHLALAQAASALDPRRPKRSLSPPASTTNADRHEPATPKIFTPTRVQLGPQPGTETTSDIPPTNAGQPRVGPPRDTYAPHYPDSDVQRTTLPEGHPTLDLFHEGRQIIEGGDQIIEEREWIPVVSDKPPGEPGH